MTKEQILKTHENTTYTQLARFVCPECQSESGMPDIENLDEEDEERPQIYCVYGCGYIFLEPIRRKI